MNELAELVKLLGDNDQVKAYQARMKLAEIVAAATAPENDAQSKVAATLAEELAAKTKTGGKDGKPGEEPQKHSAKVRRLITQFLSQVGGDAEVPALTAAIKDLEVRDMARWALERIPTAAAQAALTKAIDEVGPEFRTGVINALAKRTAPAAQAALHRQAASADEGIRLAAAESLASFPEASNDDVIMSAAKNGSARSHSRAQRARVRLAESLQRAGKKAEAVALYKAILSGDNGEPQKKAARRALEQLT